MSGSMGAVVAVIGIAVVWLVLLLRKVRQLEAKNLVNKIKSEASSTIHDKSLADLVRDTNDKADRRKP